MKRPKLVRDDSGEREGWWLGDRFVPDKPPEVDGWYRARELERELSAARAYAVSCRDLLAEADETMMSLIEDSDQTYPAIDTLHARIAAALAKNPAPAHESPAPTNADVRKPETVEAGPDTVLTRRFPQDNIKAVTNHGETPWCDFCRSFTKLHIKGCLQWRGAK
jgi:hypothetical protein